MQTTSDSKLLKIKRASTVLRAICTVALALIAFVAACCVVCVGFGVGGVNYDTVIFGTAGMALGHRLVLAVVTALALGSLFQCFFCLRRLFGNYTRGEIFTRGSVTQMKRFGITCLLWGVMNFVWGMSLSIAANQAKPFHAHFDSLGIGAVIIVIAWFMEMAVGLREENELTI